MPIGRIPCEICNARERQFRSPRHCMLVWNLFVAKRISHLGGVLVPRKHISVSILSLQFLSGFPGHNLNAQISQKPPSLGIPQSPPLVGDTVALALEAQNWLVDLLKIKTTNPPGNEQAAAKYIAR